MSDPHSDPSSLASTRDRYVSQRNAARSWSLAIVAVAVGVLAWHEPLRPLAAVGGAMVLGAGIYVARSTATS